MMETNVYLDIKDFQWPIIYRKEYNVNFLGLEKIHPFDAHKWKNVFKLLKRTDLIDDFNVTKPNKVSKDDLLVVHSKKYLRSLNCSCNVARIAEVFPLCFLPNRLVQIAYLRPMRYQTGGSILAGKLALERGWAINIGGGFHHCSWNSGGGFCPYADITLLIHFLFIHYPVRVQKVMIIDLDAHQGNGFEHDFKDNSSVFIMDVYNAMIYPFDNAAKESIKQMVELRSLTKDEEYLDKVKTNMDAAFEKFVPDLIVYNAGTDILQNDPLGRLSISPQGIIKRDEMVFEKARSMSIPIVMLTSGGYRKRTAKIIASSILNLIHLQLIEGPNKRF